MTGAESSERTESDGMVGFLDSEGKWVTMTELANEFDEPKEEVKKNVEELAEINVLRVRRGEGGEPVTAQLSPFAVDLCELPENAPVDEVAAVYVKHGVEPPMEVREKYIKEMRKARDSE